MIPPTLHRVWLGDAPIPDDYERYWEGWQERHPSWAFVTWRDADLEWLVNRAEFDASPTLSERSDVARYEIVARYGGVYIDTDVECLRPIDDLLAPSVGAFAGWEFGHRLCTAVLGGEPGHPALQALVDWLPAWCASHDGEPPDRRTGPLYLTTTWWKRRDVTRFAREIFYPVGWWQRELLGGDYPTGSYAVHHWAGSWVSNAET